MTIPHWLVQQLAKLAETTVVPADRQAEFLKWLSQNNVTDYLHPNSYFDYGGAFLAGQNRDPGTAGHFGDAYKQHGHQSFSDESVYANDPANDPHWYMGGTGPDQWEVLLRPMKQQPQDATRKVRRKSSSDTKKKRGKK